MKFYPLKDFADVIMGQSPPSSTYNEERRGMPFFQGKAEFGKRFPRIEKWCDAPTKIAEKGDILISVRAPVGPTNFCPEKSCIGRGLAAIRSKKNKSISDFLFYYLRSIEKNLASSGRGSTFASINREDLETIKIPHISYDQQRKTAFLLMSVESVLEKRRETIRLADEFLKSAFLEIFGDPSCNKRKWSEKRIVDVCEKVTDGTHYSPKAVENGFPYITAKNIKIGYFYFGNLTYVSNEDHKEIYKRCDPKPGDVLYIKDGATTGIAKFNDLPYEFSMLSSLALLRPKAQLLNARYLEHFLNMESIVLRNTNQMKGGAIKRLTIEKIKELRILVPPFDLQNKFALLVQNVEKLKDKQKQSEIELQNLFNSLMQRAFRGGLV